MNVFELARANVSARAAAEYYGILFYGSDEERLDFFVRRRRR